ncbi:MAG: endonuclease/exonuclease/phosphatase family protein [Acutalibacteraceae bacterium]
MIALILCVVFVMALAGTFVGAYVRGGIDRFPLPDGFSQGLAQIDSEKETNEVRIMTSNLLVHYKSWGGTDANPRAKMFVEMVNTYQPDVIGLQEVSDEWFACLMRNKGSYKMLYPVSTGAFLRMTALMYNSDTLTLLDKGQCKYDQGNDARLRRAVWGIFENKQTKDRFAVISTHFDCIRTNEEELMLSYMETQTKQIVEISNNIKEEYGVPVFCIGDFNTMNPGEGVDPIMDAPEIYEELCKSLTDTRLIADEKASGDALDADAPTWDHILLDGDAQINRYAVVSPEVLSDMSDHYPIFVDVEIG